MRSVEEHRAAVASLVPTPRTEVLSPGVALGRVLVRDIPAPVSLPPFTNSAMDGYAVRAAEITPGAHYPVAADIPAGRIDIPALHPGTVHRIMTGAPIPDGADAVVPVEQTTAIDADTVRIDAAAQHGKFLRHGGEDITAGQTALHAGDRVTAATVGLIAALGLTSVEVFAPVTVLVLSTGSELVEPGAPLQHGQIYESNAPMLAAALRDAGADAEVLRFVVDDAVELLDRLGARLAAGDIDLVVTTGGVSAGAYEVVKDAFTDRGLEFVKVAMQPGMPQGCGTLELPGAGTVPIITFPGNPVSALVSFEVFLRPPLRAAMGLPDRRRIRVPLSGPVSSVAGKRQFQRGILHRDTDGGESVSVIGKPGSHYLRYLAHADVLVDIGTDVTQLDAGAVVDVIDVDPQREASHRAQPLP